MTLGKKTFSDKEKNSGNQHFLPFHQCFLPLFSIPSFSSMFIFLSVNTVNLGKAKILLFGKEINCNQKEDK